MNDVSIDVLLPVGPDSPHLKEAIESILSQDFTNWKLFILIDTDNPSVDLIRSLVPSRKLRIIQFDEPFNLSKRLNFGIELGSSKYIARMDADDICHANRFSQQLQILQNTNVSLIGCGAKVINEFGVSIGDIQVETSACYITRNLLQKNQFVHPALMFTREVFQCTRYNTLLLRAQDYGFVLEVAKNFEISNISLNLLFYRLHNLNHSRDKISYREMRILRHLKFELAKILGISKMYVLLWHSIWVIKNFLLSPTQSLTIRLFLKEFRQSRFGLKVNPRK